MTVPTMLTLNIDIAYNSPPAYDALADLIVSALQRTGAVQVSSPDISWYGIGTPYESVETEPKFPLLPNGD